MRDVIVIGAGGRPHRGERVGRPRPGRAAAGGRGAPRRPGARVDAFHERRQPSLHRVLRFGPADRSRPAWPRDLPQNSAISQSSGVGGSTQHYYANSPRAMPGAFLDYAGEDRDAYDTDYLFPLGYRDLVPYYEWVEPYAAGADRADGHEGRGLLPRRGGSGLAGADHQGHHPGAFRPQENAILQPSGTAGQTNDPRELAFPQAQGCTFCGHCLQGCFEPLGAPRNLKAKRSTDNSYVPMALSAHLWARGGKAVELITDAFVVSINTDGAQSTARSVTWRIGATGVEVTEEAQVIVMACGAIETPRLWLTSDLPNPNGWVGCGLTDHHFDTIIGVMPFDTGSSKGPGSAARADFPGYGMLENTGATPAGQASVFTFSDAGIAGFYNNGLSGDAHGADSVGRLVGAELKSAMSDVDRLLSIAVLTDDDVEQQNRVTLSTTLPPDEHGLIPRVEIHQRNRSDRTKRNREYLVEQAVRLLRAAGASKVYRINTPPWLYHIHSTMRMGIARTIPFWTKTRRRAG